MPKLTDPHRNLDMYNSYAARLASVTGTFHTENFASKNFIFFVESLVFSDSKLLT